MREIKFRGRRKVDAEWLIGDLKHIDGKVFIFPRTEDTPLNSPDWFEVDPETVGQFTVFTDSKLRDVYEGDVYFSEVENDDGDDRTFYVVTWIWEWAMFALLSVAEYNEYLDTGIEHLDDNGVPYNIEIDSLDRLHYKGNIHDNPELLKH